MSNKDHDILDLRAHDYIRDRKLCDRTCPAFTLCPLVPLAVHPTDRKRRVCLVNSGNDEIKRAYYGFFVEGRSFVIDEYKRGILEYGILLRSLPQRGPNAPTAKEKMRYIERMNAMMLNLAKISPKTKKEDDPDNAEEAVVIDSGEKPAEEPKKEHPIIEKYFGKQAETEQK